MADTDRNFFPGVYRGLRNLHVRRVEHSDEAIGLKVAPVPSCVVRAA
jgi:hypothetical protein